MPFAINAYGSALIREKGGLAGASDDMREGTRAFLEKRHVGKIDLIPPE